MKRWVTLITVLSLFLFGSTAMARGNGEHKGNDDDHYKSCRTIPAGMMKQLDKMHDTQKREGVKKALKQYKEKCGGRDDDDEHDGVRLSAAQRVANDKAVLRIVFGGSDTADSVTVPIKLSVKGKYGSMITWSSSRPDIVSPDGTIVNRPAAGDVNVTLTARISYNGTVVTVTFVIKVKAAVPVQTDGQRVASDKAALAISFNGTDNAGQVTQPLKLLPLKGAAGSTISWISSMPGVISNDGGTVVRPTAADATVTLTALISYGSVTDTKTFQLIVKQQLSDAQAVAADKAALDIDFGGNDTAASVTRALDVIPSRGVNGSTIIWISGSPAVLSADGKTLVRPAAGSGDASVTLTAVISRGSASETKTFTLTVKDQFTNLEVLAADKADLAIGFGAGDSAAAVTRPLTLPAKGVYGSTILWYSSDPAIVSDNGKVIKRPALGQGDATVTMIAYLSCNGAGDFKTFTITVKQMP